MGHAKQATQADRRREREKRAPRNSDAPKPLDTGDALRAANARGLSNMTKGAAPPTPAAVAPMPQAAPGTVLAPEPPRERAAPRPVEREERHDVAVPKSWIVELAAMTGEDPRQPMAVLRAAVVLLRHLTRK